MSPVSQPSGKQEVSLEPSTMSTPSDTQVNLSFCPQNILDSIAKKNAVPVESLAKMVVKASNSKTYNAILEYTAMLEAASKHKFKTLVVDGWGETYDDSDDDEEDCSNWVERMDHFAMMFPSSRGKSMMRRGHGMRRMRIPTPKIKFSTGITSIVWPPPEHLTAEALIAQREGARKIRKLNSSKKAALSKGAKSEEDKVKENEDMSEGASTKEINEGNVQETNGKKQDEKETQHTIYLAHYTVGGPVNGGDCQPVVYREITLVSTEGYMALCNFAAGIIKWHTEKNHRESDGSRFALHRFKMDGGGRGFWKPEGMKRARPPSSVILPEGQLESILKDVENYIHPDTKKWHRDHGLQHRRSFLFFGPPGTGKTSTIRAIASKFRLNCCFLSMTSPNFNNQALADALHQVPSNALIVLEDVDTIFNEDRKNATGGLLTFSGLLNALDGLMSADGVITIMTTNHIERLDKALIRSGRVDRRFHFDRPTNEQISKLFRSFYPNAAKEIVQKFLKAVTDRPEVEEARSIATLQQLFIDQRLSTAEECANNVPAFFESHFPNGSIKDSANIYM